VLLAVKAPQAFTVEAPHRLLWLPQPRLTSARKDGVVIKFQALARCHQPLEISESLLHCSSWVKAPQVSIQHQKLRQPIKKPFHLAEAYLTG
jgi:hypothetical protein